jgi:diguanylate cyclase (GGDEF)-like protein
VHVGQCVVAGLMAAADCCSLRATRPANRTSPVLSRLPVQVAPPSRALPRWRWGRAAVSALLGALLAVPCGAQTAPTAPSVVAVGPQMGAVSVTPFLDALEDPRRELDIAAIRAEPAASRFAPVGRSANYGFSRSAWWMRFGLRNTSTQPTRVVLRQDYPLIDHLEWWVSDANTIVTTGATGDLLPFRQRPIEHQDFLIPIDLAPGRDYTVHLRFVSEGSVNVGLQLYSTDALVPAIAREQLAFGAFYGSFVLLATSSLLLYLIVRDRAFLYYFLYVVTYGTYMAAYHGLTYQLLWPDSPRFASFSQIALLAMSLILLLQFSRVMLETRTVAPRLDRGVRILQGLTFLCLLAAPVLPYHTVIVPIAVLTLVIVLYLLLLGARSTWAGIASARYYLMALSVFLVGVVVYMLKTFGWIPHNFITQHGFQLGSLSEFVLLSVALSHRISELKHKTVTDSLTGLYNRRYFNDLLAQEFRDAVGHRRDLALLVFDVDHFKRYNDEHGHAQGDQALQAVATSLRRNARNPDALCRYGGEEFVLIMPGASLEQAVEVAEQLRAQVAAEGAANHRLTLSAGVASIGGQRYASGSELFEAADQALYRAKDSGRNRVVAHRGGFAPAVGSPATAGN